LAKIQELEAEAAQVQLEADERLGKIMAQIRDTANGASGSYQVGNGAPKPDDTGTGKKTAVSKPTAKRKAVKKKPSAAGSKRANAQPLREVIWDILAKSPNSWKKSLDGELPKGATGLKAVELKRIIEAEELWISDSNIAGQISTHLKAYREAGKMELGEQKRYYIVDGAEFE